MLNTKKSKVYTYHIIIALLGFLMIYPILWTIASSLKPEDEIFRNASSLIPSFLKWENYVQGWKGFGNITFTTFFMNSTFVTFMVVLGTIISSTLVAFGFARIKFRFRTPLFICLLATLMLPQQVTLIPQYILFHNLGWVNTYLRKSCRHSLEVYPSLFSLWCNSFAESLENWMKQHTLTAAALLAYFGGLSYL